MCYDVLVIGGGNAGLCAAISAAENGSKVLLLERAPKFYRGGNSRHTRDIRYSHDKPNKYTIGMYTNEEFLNDVLSVNNSETDIELAKYCINNSKDIVFWMEKHGVKFQPTIKGALHLANSVAFFSGGGKSLVNSYYTELERLGVNIIYNAYVVDLNIRENRFISALVDYKFLTHEIEAKSVILSSGGFQSDILWLKENWGKPANNFIIRGTPYNEGNILKILLNNKAQSVGNPNQGHMLALDARSPKFDGGIVTRLDCIPFSIVVNKYGERFYDEGEDIWPKRYAIWGRILASQPDQEGYAIFDSKVSNLFMPSAFPPLKSDSIVDLAKKINIDPTKLLNTINRFNEHVIEGSFNPSKLDGCHTFNLDPPKSNWALKIDKSPFFAYPLKPGLTFTYLALKVNKKAQVLNINNEPFDNIFAAGEIMAGNILRSGYMAGFGLTIGTVFGITAGREAAKC